MDAKAWKVAWVQTHKFKVSELLSAVMLERIDDVAVFEFWSLKGNGFATMQMIR